MYAVLVFIVYQEKTMKESKQEPNRNRSKYLRYKTFTLVKEGDTYVYRPMDGSRKNFGSPVKAKSRKGKTSPWVKRAISKKK